MAYFTVSIVLFSSNEFLLENGWEGSYINLLIYCFQLNLACVFGKSESIEKTINQSHEVFQNG